MSTDIYLGDWEQEPVTAPRTYTTAEPYHQRIAKLNEDLRWSRAFIAYCVEHDRDIEYHFRREFIDVFCRALALGIFPLGLARDIDDAAADLNIDGGTVDRLILELETLLDNYTAQQPLNLNGGALMFGEYADLTTQPGRATTAGFPEPTYAPVLPDEFWTARPAFTHIRDAARARLVAPDGVLAAVLMRVAALTDHRILLPDIIGRYASLNAAAVLVAPSGGGKGSSLDTARDLIRVSTLTGPRFKEAPIGSGEGMVKTYFAQNKTQDESGKTVTAWEQTIDAIAFRVDEGEMLASLAARSGQTTMTNIRALWSGEQLGTLAADRDRGFTLPAHGYRASLIMGVQPEHAAFLLDDAAGGTPQRFVWAVLVDPDAPDLDAFPTGPGQLDWQPPDWHDAAPITLGGYARGVMHVSPTIVAELRARRLAITRGQLQPDPLDAHRDLVQLKTAALLAVFDGRLNITDDDWHLASIIVDTSRRARGWVQGRIRNAAEIAEEGAIARSTRRAVAVEAAKTDASRHVERVAELLARRVAAAGPEGLTRGALRKAITSKDRDVFEPALAHTLDRGLIDEFDGRYIAAST